MTAKNLPDQTRCAVLHPDSKLSVSARLPDLACAEAVSLAQALNLDVELAEIVPLRAMNASTLFGSGKVRELKDKFMTAEVEVVVINGTVSPVQQRNLEKEWNLKVLDRTGLILEIFADRAHTREGVLQVDLAHLTYQKSRLVRSWTHLERQRGSTGTVGGPGETQQENDRRAIEAQIIKIKGQLQKVVKTRALHRQARKKVPYPIVALVGYTNAGKSSIFNAVTGAEVLAKDMLFATLDPTMRGATLPSGKKVIFSDTVGFISNLPTQLVAAFRATLEEVLDADLILHVRDISHPETSEQALDVRAILEDLGVSENQIADVTEVWNKIDNLDENSALALRQTAERELNVVITSATTGAGMSELLELVERNLSTKSYDDVVETRFDQGKLRAWLFNQSVIQAEKVLETGYSLQVRWTEKQRNQYLALANS